MVSNPKVAIGNDTSTFGCYQTSGASPWSIRYSRELAGFLCNVSHNRQSCRRQWEGVQHYALWIDRHDSLIVISPVHLLGHIWNQHRQTVLVLGWGFAAVRVERVVLHGWGTVFVVIKAGSFWVKEIAALDVGNICIKKMGLGRDMAVHSLRAKWCVDVTMGLPANLYRIMQPSTRCRWIWELKWILRDVRWTHCDTAREGLGVVRSRHRIKPRPSGQNRSVSVTARAEFEQLIEGLVIELIYSVNRVGLENYLLWRQAAIDNAWKDSRQVAGVFLQTGMKKVNII